MLGIAARLAAKKLAKKQLDDVPDYFEKAKAAEKTAKKRDIAEKVGIGAGTVAVAPIAAELGSQYGQQAEDLRELGREKRASEKLQKQYEAQDKQEGRGMKKGGKVSSVSKRADGIAVKGKTRGRMI
jgi:uncharacterized protein with von Willebrand factor type A (vWA) domain